MHKQVGKDATADNHLYSREVPTTKAATNSVVTDLQEKLELQEQKHDAVLRKSACLTERYFKLKAVKKEQSDIIESQAGEIQLNKEILDSILFKLVEPYAKRNKIQVDEWTPEPFLEVLTSLSRDAADASSYAVEMSSLTEQVQMLQKEMFAKVEKVHVASDEQFAQDFRVLASSIKSLSRTISINDAEDTANILSAGFLFENVPHHHWIGRPKKKILVEAWVWSVLMQHVFRTPFAIFGKQCDLLNANWQCLYMSEHCHDWPIPTSLSENWRCTSVESLLELVDRDVITHGKCRQVLQKLEPEIVAARKNVYQIIGSYLFKISTKGVNPSEVQSIVDKAFTFAMEMSRQRIRLQVTFPKAGDKFDSDTMRFKSDTDEEDMDDSVVAFIINPGLTKWGDTHGKNFDHRYDIIPALVYLETLLQQEVGSPKAESQMWANVVKDGLQKPSTLERKNEGESRR